MSSLLFVLGALTAAGCGESESKPGTTIIPADAWHTYTSPDGQFAATFPGYAGPRGWGGVKVVSVQTISPTVEFELKFTDLSAADADAAAKNFDEFAKTKLLKDLGRGRVVDTRERPHQGYPGREVTVEPEDGKGTIFRRLYLVKTRLYQLELSGPELPADTPYVGMFLDSFQVKAPPPPPKPTTAPEAPSTKPGVGGDQGKSDPPPEKGGK